MEKTYSQKIARFFEIADCFLLIPAIFGLIAATVIPSWFTVIIWTIFLLGIFLLIGYIKHSRNRLNEKYVSILWLGTFFYNSIFLLSLFLFFIEETMAEQSILDRVTIRGFTIFTFCAFWWIVAVILSAIAFKNFKVTQKYR